MEADQRETRLVEGRWLGAPKIPWQQLGD